MRVLQTRVKPDWLTNSKDPANSFQAWIGGAPQKVLVDDQGVSTKINPLEVVVLDMDNGIAFFAKDRDTLVRGLSYVAKSPKTANKREYYLKSKDASNLAAVGLSWDSGELKHKNSLAAGISTVGFNLSVAVRRTMFNATRHVSFSDTDYYQSVSDNMDSAGRDGKQLQRGAAMFVCPAMFMPNSSHWGKTFRQIGDTLTLGMIATIAPQLFRK